LKKILEQTSDTKQDILKLSGQVGGLAGQVSGVQGLMGTLQTEFVNLRNETQTRFAETDKTLAKIQEESTKQAAQILELQNRPAVVAVGGGGGGGGGEGRTGGGGGAGGVFVPINKRKVLFVGGFPYNSERDAIVAKFREMVAPCVDTIAPEGLFTTRKITSFGKIAFKTNDDMWSFINANKSSKFTFEEKEIYWSIDKTEEETNLSKRVTKAVKLLKEHYATNGIAKEDLKKYISAEWNFGVVYFKDSLVGKFVEAFTKPKGQNELKVNPAAVVPWGLNLNEHIDTINQIKP
jgi:hypothetical protein